MQTRLTLYVLIFAEEPKVIWRRSEWAPKYRMHPCASKLKMPARRCGPPAAKFKVAGGGHALRGTEPSCKLNMMYITNHLKRGPFMKKERKPSHQRPFSALIHRWARRQVGGGYWGGTERPNLAI